MRCPRHEPRGAGVAFLAFCCAAAGPQRAVASDADAKRATLLDKDTFNGYLDQQRKQKRPALIMFHVSWCKVCQRTFPKFAGASELIHTEGIGMDFAHVDCTDEKSLCQEYDVKGYPSLKLFYPEAEVRSRNFKGQRTEEQFVRYARRMTEPPVREGLKNSADLVQAIEGETLAMFVASGAKAEGAQLPAGLVQAAEAWMDRHLFVTPAAGRPLADLMPAGLEPPAGATLAVFSAGKVQQWPGHLNVSNQAAAFYDGSLDDVGAVAQWVEQHRFPGVWALHEGNFFEFTHANVTAAMVAVEPGRTTAEDEAFVYAAHRALGQGPGGKDRLLFGMLDGAAWEDELQDFNIKRAELPRVLVTEENLEVWIEDHELLRLESLEKDLRSFLDGAPLLRQGKGMLSKAFFYKREAERYSRALRAYAERGPMELALAVIGVAVGGSAVLFILWAIGSCLRSLLDDDEEELIRQGYASRHKPPGQVTRGAAVPAGRKQD